MDLTWGKKENGVGLNGIILEVNRMYAFALGEKKDFIKIIVPMWIGHFKIPIFIKQFNLKLNLFFRFQIEFIYAINGNLVHVMY